MILVYRLHLVFVKNNVNLLLFNNQYFSSVNHKLVESYSTVFLLLYKIIVTWNFLLTNNTLINNKFTYILKGKIKIILTLLSYLCKYILLIFYFWWIEFI